MLANRKKVDVPTRHSRFLPHFMKTNSRGIKKLSYKVEETDKDDNPFKGQRKTPVRMTDYKKVVPLEL